MKNLFIYNIRQKEQLFTYFPTFKQCINLRLSKPITIFLNLTLNFNYKESLRFVSASSGAVFSLYIEIEIAREKYPMKMHQFSKDYSNDE